MAAGRAERLFGSALAAELAPTRQGLLSGQVRPEQERLISATIEARTPEYGAALRTAVDAWSAPQPAEDGTPDPRTPGQRRHDALQALAETALNPDPTRPAGLAPATLFLLHVI